MKKFNDINSCVYFEILNKIDFNKQKWNINLSEKSVIYYCIKSNFHSLSRRRSIDRRSSSSTLSSRKNIRTKRWARSAAASSSWFSYRSSSLNDGIYTSRIIFLIRFFRIRRNWKNWTIISEKRSWICDL